VTSYLPHIFHAGYFLCGSSCLEKIQEQCFSASKFQKPSKINVFLKPLLETFMKEVFVDTVFRYLAFLMASLTFNNSQKLLSDSWCSPLIHSFRPEKIDLKFAFFLLHWPTVSGILLALFWKPIFTKFPFFRDSEGLKWCDPEQVSLSRSFSTFVPVTVSQVRHIKWPKWRGA